VQSDPGVVGKIDHCPICSVVCACSKCKRRLVALALELKRLGEEQATEPAINTFEDIFTCFKDIKPAARSHTTSKRRDSIASSATENAQPNPDALVAKPLLSDTNNSKSFPSSQYALERLRPRKPIDYSII
jgi:hypothetical protein